MWWSEVPIIAFRRLVYGVCLTLLLTGCAGGTSIATPFTRSAVDYTSVPVDALRELAREIEVQIAEGNRRPELNNRDGIVVETEEFAQAVRTRAARVELVHAFLSTGHGWERRDGRLWVIRSEAYKASGTSRSRDLDALMVNGENRNRWTMYEAIVDESDLPSKALSAVEEIFFEARLELMQPGQKYEDEEGEKVVKE